MRDLAEEDPLEVEASKFNLNYIKLDGNDRLHGERRRPRDGDDGHHQALRRRARPTSSTSAAGAAQEAVKNAFRILVSDPNIKAVLINIFGGIARSDRIASGVVGAIEELGNVKLPVVVRLEGTNVEQGREILRKASFKFIVADDMADAAEKVVAAAVREVRRWRSGSNNETRLVVQGITGKEGKFHALGCRDYGTKVVGGVTPGKGGETVEGIPVFDTVAEARAKDRRQRHDDLRAAAVRGRRDHGGRRRRHRAHRLHHRGHPGDRHGQGARPSCASKP